MKLNETGMLDELFVLDNFILETSEGNYRCSFEQTGRASYKASTPFADIFMNYYCERENWLVRKFSVQAKTDFSLFSVKNELLPRVAPLDSFLYSTFRDASAAVFVRHEKDGFFTGFENPFVRLINVGEMLVVCFSPDLRLRTGETFDCDGNFFGRYRPSYFRQDTFGISFLRFARLLRL